MARPAALAIPPRPAGALPKCAVCERGLFEPADIEAGVCSEHPKAAAGRRVHLLKDSLPGRPAANDAPPPKARAFTAADKSLIRKVHGYMPHGQLLSLLNERQVADVGSAAVPYTMAQLHAEIGQNGAAELAGRHDWASLRKLIAHAKAEGTLELVNEQVIDDFAVVYSLTPGQVSRVKDVLLRNGDDE